MNVLKMCLVGLTVLAGAGAAVADFASDYVQDHLIAQYDAVENAGPRQHATSPAVWKDLIGDHDLVPTGTPTFGDAAVTFTSTTQRFEVDFPAFVTAVENGACTVELRFKPKSRQDGSTLFTLGFNANESQRFLGLYCWSGNIYDGIMFRDNHGYSSGCANVADGVDHTATFVIDGSAIKVYHDGVLKYSHGSGGVAAGSSLFTLGTKTGSCSLLADIESVRIYDAVLTAEQISINRSVDVERFVNGHIGHVPFVIVTTDHAGVEGGIPPCGKYYEAGAFTAKEVTRGEDGYAYRCTGYTFATFDGTDWSPETDHPGEFAFDFDPERDGQGRVMWKWERAPAFDTDAFAFRAVTIDNAVALAALETDLAELSFGADVLGRSAGTVDKLYIAYGTSSYAGDDVALYDHVAFVADVPIDASQGTYRLPAGYGTDYLRFRFFLQTFSSKPSDLYSASESLIGQWDAIDNAGRAIHEAAPSVWKDLVSTNDLSFVGTPTFGARCIGLTDPTGQRFVSDSCGDLVKAVTDQAFTLEIHFTPYSSANDDFLFSLGYSSDFQRRYLGIYTWSGNIYDGIMYRQTSGTSSGCPGVASGREHTMSLVVNGDKAYLYQDGVLKNTRACGWCAEGGNIFTIGSPFMGVTRTLQMDVFSVRAYAKSLTEGEILANVGIDQLRFAPQSDSGSVVSFSEVVVSDISVATWHYDAVNGTIANGEWVLNVSAKGPWLTVLGTAQTSLKTLDLKKRIFDDLTGEEYFVGTIGRQAFDTAPIFDYHRTGTGASAENPLLVKLPSTLGSIEEKAFCHCTYMMVDELLPVNVTNIGQYAFYSCVTITNDLYVGYGGKPVGMDSFCFSTLNATYGYMNIRSLHFGPGVTYIPENGFSYNSAIEAEFSDSLTYIGFNAFFGDTDLNLSRGFPDSIETIGSYAFYACYRGLTNAIVIGTAGRPVSLGDFAFAAASTAHSMIYPSITLGEGVTKIPNGLCWYNERMTNVTFSVNVTSIGGYAFQYAHALTNSVFDIGTNTWIDTCAFASWRVENMNPTIVRFHGYRGDYRAHTSQYAPFQNWDGAKLCFYLPRTEPGWDAAINGKLASLTDAEKVDFKTRFPTAKMPVGRLTESVSLMPSGSWIVRWTPPEFQNRGLVIYLK